MMIMQVMMMMLTTKEATPRVKDRVRIKLRALSVYGQMHHIILFVHELS